MSNTATYTATEAVAREIRGLLAKAGLTQKDVARILAITQAGVSDRLRGKQNFSLDELLTLAGALNLTIGDLLGDSIVSARVPAPSYYRRRPKDGLNEKSPLSASYRKGRHTR